MLRCTSSSASDQGKAPASISERICASPFSIASRSGWAMIPAACSIRAWAREASMSNAASLRSKATDAVNRRTRSVGGSANRPDHGLLVLSLADMQATCLLSR
jgi:hypothetical protein